MKITKTKQTNLNFDYTTAASLLSLREVEEFGVGFDDLWQWCGYARKDSAKRKLVKNFEEGLDFRVHQVVEPSPAGGLTNLEIISLTVDASKEFAMLAQTEQGKQVRKYFIEAEKQYRTNLIRIREQQEFVVGQLKELKIAQTAMRQEIVNELRSGLAPIGTLERNIAGWMSDFKKNLQTLTNRQPTLNKIFSVIPAGYESYEDFKVNNGYVFKRGTWKVVKSNLNSSMMIEKSPLNRVEYFNTQHVIDTLNTLNVTGAIKIEYGKTGNATKATISI